MVVCAPEPVRRRAIAEKPITGDVIPQLGPDVSWLVMRFLNERDLVHTRVRCAIVVCRLVLLRFWLMSVGVSSRLTLALLS